MIRRLVRFWFTFETPVSRGAYLRHGACLMAAKYAGDAALVAAATATWWSPADYLRSVPFLLETKLAQAPSYLAPALALWTLPFLWIGVTMTLRRLLDAGRSAWMSLLFFIPYVSYLLMAALAVAPPRGGEREPEPPRREEPRLPSALASMGIGLAFGLGMIVLGVRLLSSYGLALFLGTPFTIGVVTAFLFCRRYPASTRETLEVVAMTVLFVGGAAFLLGTEGAICLVMMLPLGLVLAMMGGVVGRGIALRGTASTSGAAMVLLLLPSSAAWEGRIHSAPLREVRTAIDIEATPATVWQRLIAFPPLGEPKDLLFRIGIAYPERAEIVGSGVGAVRYCVFSTGAFVEPITRWEPERRLSFDVVESPHPLREWTPYEGIEPQHLDGYLVPRRGEFRLVPLANGGTRLEGSTWYEQRLRPEGYWVLFSDAIIRRIHRRVLEHVKSQAQRPVATPAGGG